MKIHEDAYGFLPLHRALYLLCPIQTYTQNIMSGNLKGLEQKGGNVLEQTAHGYTASESMYSSDISSIFTVQ